MSLDEIETHIERLELKLMHQEAAIDELTRTVLQQEQLIATQSLTIERLDAMLRSLSENSPASPDQEPPPPHY